MQIKYSERVSISINLASILLDATLQRSKSVCEAEPSLTWQARTASWTLWNSDSLVTVLSKKFSLVSSLITGPTKQKPNMASVHKLKYKDGRQWYLREKMTICSITCYYLKHLKQPGGPHATSTPSGKFSYPDMHRGLFLAEDATIPNIRNVEHCGLFSLLHYYNNFKIQSLVWHLQFASWNKWEQDLLLTQLITSVLYFH